jgi:hypothetical protein
MQIFSCNVNLTVPMNGATVTEASFKRWLARKLKDCELGDLAIGDPVEFSRDMVDRAVEARRRKEE